MKKEVLIAIIIGFSIGLFATVGIHLVRTRLNPPEDTQITTSSPTPQTTSVNHTLGIVTPSQNSIVRTDSTPVSGLTSPNAIVTLISPEEEQVARADSNGSFSSSILLQAGPNTIKAVSYTPDGREATAFVDVVYTTAEIAPEDEAEETDADTQDTNDTQNTDETE